MDNFYDSFFFFDKIYSGKKIGALKVTFLSLVVSVVCFQNLLPKYPVVDLTLSHELVQVSLKMVCALC